MVAETAFDSFVVDSNDPEQANIGAIVLPPVFLATWQPSVSVLRGVEGRPNICPNNEEEPSKTWKESRSHWVCTMVQKLCSQKIWDASGRDLDVKSTW